IAAERQAQKLFPGQWMLSVCTKSEGSPGVLLSGEPMTDLLTKIDDAFALGVNCIAALAVEAQVRLLRQLAPPHVRIMAYANIGAADELDNWVCTDADDPDQYAKYAMRWIDTGATIVGECCGTTPQTIAAIAAQVKPVRWRSACRRARLQSNGKDHAAQYERPEEVAPDGED